MDWKKTYKSKLVSFEEAASKIKSGDTIWVAPGASAPETIVKEMCKREELENVTAIVGLTLYNLDCFKPEFKGRIGVSCWYMGPYSRAYNKFGNVDVHSISLSLIDNFMDKLNPNVILVEVSEPDENGYMSHGPTGVLNKQASKNADRIIVQVNKNIPYMYGENNIIHVSEVTCITEYDHPVPELPQVEMSEVDKGIANHIIPHIPDGATIQFGIGGTANAVGYGLKDKKDLGVHSEMFTESMVYLHKAGVINNSKKNYKPGIMPIVFSMGNKELYDFMDKNPEMEMRSFAEVNNPDEIAKNDNMISINNALNVDLTGQVSSESIGYNQFSSTGGQLDFVRGAAKSKGGKSFICLPSTVDTKEGIKSRITLSFSPGTAVTVPRSDAQYIVTEYGIADVYCKSIPERAKALINIAHPDFREELTKQAIEVGILHQ